MPPDSKSVSSAANEVVRQNRLYARGSAQMLAETWRGNLSRVADRRRIAH